MKVGTWLAFVVAIVAMVAGCVPERVTWSRMAHAKR